MTASSQLDSRPRSLMTAYMERPRHDRTSIDIDLRKVGHGLLGAWAGKRGRNGCSGDLHELRSGVVYEACGHLQCPAQQSPRLSPVLRGKAADLLQCVQASGCG